MKNIKWTLRYFRERRAAQGPAGLSGVELESHGLASPAMELPEDQELRESQERVENAHKELHETLDESDKIVRGNLGFDHTEVWDPKVDERNARFLDKLPKDAEHLAGQSRTGDDRWDRSNRLTQFGHNMAQYTNCPKCRALLLGGTISTSFSGKNTALGQLGPLLGPEFSEEEYENHPAVKALRAFWEPRGLEHRSKRLTILQNNASAVEAEIANRGFKILNSGFGTDLCPVHRALEH